MKANEQQMIDLLKRTLNLLNDPNADGFQVGNLQLVTLLVTVPMLHLNGIAQPPESLKLLGVNLNLMKLAFITRSMIRVTN